MSLKNNNSNNLNMDLVTTIFDHIESQGQLADIKAGLLLTADAFFLNGFIALIISNKTQDYMSETAIGILIAAIILLLVSILLVLFGINPVHRTHHYDQYQVFFKQICNEKHNANSKEYEKNFRNLTDDQILGQMLRSTHGKSEWASRKMKLINIACSSTLVSIFLGILTFTLVFIRFVIE